MKTILFQGDSITDAGRQKEDDTNYNLGYGYATLVKAEIGLDYLGKYDFYNRGISGNRIVDLYARIKKDILNLKPDIMSILIGVNDVWHEFSNNNGINTEKYFKIYSMLIEEIKAELPDIKIIILEPFVLNGTGTCDYYAQFREDVESKAKKAKLIAEKYNLSFVPLQKLFDDAAKNVPSSVLLEDGVHPTAIGHEIIKREWIKAFEAL